MIDVRNRAILAVAYDAMLRRSELVALQVVDVTRERGGSASLLVRRAKNDPEGRRRHAVPAPRQREAAPGMAERERDRSSGPLFRSMRKDGTVGGRLPAGQVPRIYKAMAERAGLPAHMVRRSGHSPRVGAAQDMIASGIGIPAIMQAARWKSAAMVQRYGERLLARRNGAAQLARLQKRR